MLGICSELAQFIHKRDWQENEAINDQVTSRESCGQGQSKCLMMKAWLAEVLGLVNEEEHTYCVHHKWRPKPWSFLTIYYWTHRASFHWN